MQGIFLIIRFPFFLIALIALPFLQVFFIPVFLIFLAGHLFVRLISFPFVVVLAAFFNDRYSIESHAKGIAEILRMVGQLPQALISAYGSLFKWLIEGSK